MKNIFENFDLLDIDEMRFEVALFQTMSVENFANEMKTTVINAGSKLINRAAELVNRKGVEETKVEKISGLMEEKYNEIAGLTKEELHFKMLDLVKEKLQTMGIDECNLDNEDKVSICAIREAAVKLAGGIGAEASIGQKADDIAENFSKKQIDNLKTNVIKSRMDRDLLSHLIWKSSIHGEKYFPMELEEAPDEDKWDSEYWEILKSSSLSHDKEKELSLAIANAENRISGDKSVIADLENKLMFTEKRLLDFEVKGQSECADAESTRRVKDLTEKQLRQKKVALAESETNLTTLKYDLQYFEEQKEEWQEKENRFGNHLFEIVRRKWTNQIVGLEIEDEVISHLISIYPLKERKILESALVELGSSSAPEVMAVKDTITGKYHYTFVISKKAMGKIIFEKNEQKVRVTNILKLRR